MVRDVARRLKAEHNFFLPSALYNKYTSAIDGSFKMSKTERETTKIEIPEKN